MSNVIICIILFIIILIAIRSFVERAAHGCCGGGDKIKRVKTDKNISHYKYEYSMSLEGMSCKHCKQSVENALNSLGEIYACADFNKNSAVIYSKKKYDEQVLKNAVSSAGFTVKRVALKNEK
jgi:copper chaperone CopZ